jgi:hypothetical protein
VPDLQCAQHPQQQFFDALEAAAIEAIDAYERAVRL